MSEFESARDDYLALMRRVPPGALGYLRPGDDYSVGGVAVHVNYVLEHYRRILERMVAEGFAEFHVDEPPELEAQARERARSALPAEAISHELAETERLHDGVAAAVEHLGAERSRKAAVWYAGGGEAYPTSAEDVVGWLTEHYREHVPHVSGLIAEVT